MRRITLFISALVLVLALAIPNFATAAGNGAIQGSIANKTKDTKSGVDNQEITLTTYASGVSTGQATTKTDAQGKFSFTGLATDAASAYQITFIYQTANYVSDPIIFASGETSKTVDMSVYDTTSDDSVLSLGVVHTIMTPQTGSLRVIQFYAFVNSSDRAYIGSQAAGAAKASTLTLSIPANATNLEYDGLSPSVLTTADGIADTWAVLPGEQDVTISWEAPQSGSFNLVQKLGVPTLQYNLLVEGPNAQISNSQLTRVEPVNFNGKLYSHFTGNNIPKDTTLTGNLSFPAGGAGNSSNSSSTSPLAPWFIVAAVLLGGALVLTLMLRKKRAPVAAAIAGEGADGPQEALLAEIAALDDEFESGNISRESYEEQRAEKKAQLIELLLGTKGESSKE